MTHAPGLLLLHGVGDAGACWGPFVARLRRQPGLADLHVLTPDAPSHGGRPLEDGRTMAWPDLISHAIEQARQLAERTGGPIVSAGHSMGAMMALGVSAYRPDLVAATFLEDPPLQSPLPRDDAERQPAQPVDVSEFGQWFASVQAIPLEDLVAAARTEHPNWDEDEYEPWARAKRAVDLAAFREPVLWVHADTENIIRTAPAPVVVAAGRPELGGLVTEAAGADLAALPGWTVHRLPTGHDVRRDAPDQTVALLAGLLHSVAR